MKLQPRPGLSLVEKAENLVRCLQDDASEDAFNWCLDILQDLHGDAIRRRVAIEEAVRNATR